MKSFKRISAIAMSIACLSATAATAVGCGKVSDTEETLEIFITNAGYGTAWLDAEIEAFKEQDWVKEKYPNLIIPKPGFDSVTIPADKVTAGGKANTADLLISCQPASTQYNAKLDGKCVFEDLTEVYESTVPGEDIKLKDKMYDGVYDAQFVQFIDGTENEGTYYAVPWVRGEGCIVYNKTKLEKYMGEGYETPNTTNEFVALAHTLKDKMVAAGTDDAPMAFTASVGYWGSPTAIWWAQYEGKEKRDNYYEGLWENSLGDLEYNVKSITDQKGRLEALKVLESLIFTTNGLNHKACMTDPFMKLQSKFMVGEAGVFLPVGDWIMTEMAGTPTDQTIMKLKMPVVSSIVEKLEMYTHGETRYSALSAAEQAAYDSKLSAVVEAVDDGLSYSADLGVSENDFNRIKEARNMFSRMTGHEMFVPSYANGKEVAKDFIRFMATDEAIEIFMETTKGTVSPYKYEASEELKAKFYPFQKERYEAMDEAVELRSVSSFRLVMYGGLKQWQVIGRLDTIFGAQDKDDRRTAQEVYDAEIEHWTTSGNANFELLLSAAGLKN